MVWLPPPLCAFPTNHHHCVRCPALSAVCVSGGTTHSRPLWCHHAAVCVSVSGVATTPTTHAVVPCALSLLSLAMPHLPHSHKCHASLHSHTHGVLCVAPPIHTHTHWLADCPHALHTPPPLGVRVLIHLLSSATHTHGTHRRGPCMGGCWCGHHHHAPCAPPSHTHSGTGGVGHGGAWWCACALCVPPTPPSHSPSLPPPPPTLLCHHRPHSHTRDLVHASLPHTHATCTTTHTKACCVLTTPCHTHHHPLHPPIHTHTTWHTHTASATLPQWCLPSLTTPSTHTTDATHTPHRRQTKAKHTTGCGFS